MAKRATKKAPTEWIISGFATYAVNFIVEAQTADEAREKVDNGEWMECDRLSLTDWNTTSATRRNE